MNVDADLYEHLVRVAAEVCRGIAADPPGPDGPGRQRARRVWESAHRFATLAPSAPAEPAGESAVEEALRKLAADWPAIRAGTLGGEMAYAAAPGLWPRLMTEPPMGTFAELAASFVNERVDGDDLVVELGAGEGATSRLLRLPAAATFLRTDANAMLVRRPGLPGSPVRYDFDEPSAITGAALVLAVNSLHCARDRVRSLGHVRDMLRPGGCVAVCEGAATTDPTGLPHVLDAVFGQFRGWWDRDGFVDADTWAADLTAAGLTVAGRADVTAGPRVLGSLLWATRG